MDAFTVALVACSAALTLAILHAAHTLASAVFVSAVLTSEFKETAVRYFLANPGNVSPSKLLRAIADDVAQRASTKPKLIEQLPSDDEYEKRSASYDDAERERASSDPADSAAAVDEGLDDDAPEDA